MPPSTLRLRPECLLGRAPASTSASAPANPYCRVATTAVRAEQRRHLHRSLANNSIIQQPQRSIGHISYRQTAAITATAATATVITRRTVNTTTPYSAPEAAAATKGKGQRTLPALFVRSGTSNGLVLRASDLPPTTTTNPPESAWADILPAAMGSPDPIHGRQLDGIGGGISSTSKVCVLSVPPAERRHIADVDFTFVQVGVRDGRLDLAGNCGNMSAVVGPVAWDWGFVGNNNKGVGERVNEVQKEEGGRGEKEAVVRIFNTNTNKIMHTRFRVVASTEGKGEREENNFVYCPTGPYAMDGVPGTGSRITLSFLDPAGAKTGCGALPTGNVVDDLDLSDHGFEGVTVRASLVDVSNPGVFVSVNDIGLSSSSSLTLTPATVEADERLKAKLEAVRRAGAVRMGLDPEVESVPKIVLLFPEEDGAVASGNGDGDGEGAVDVRCLAMSMGQAHKAVPLTLALCLGAAANIEGTVAWKVRRKRSGADGHGASKSVVIGHPSGSVEIGATFDERGNIVSADLHRTARVLMKGDVYY